MEEGRGVVKSELASKILQWNISMK